MIFSTQDEGLPVVLTVTELANHKKLPETLLRSHGVRDSRDGVVVPYYGSDKREARTRLRKAIRAKDGSSWLLGGGNIICYGVWQISYFWSRQPLLVLVEGETDCWTLWHHGINALGVPGHGMVGKLRREDVAGFDEIYYVREPGIGGDSFAVGVSARLKALGFSGALYELSLGEDKDPSDLHIRLNGDTTEFIKYFGAKMLAAKRIEFADKKPEPATAAKKRLSPTANGEKTPVKFLEVEEEELGEGFFSTYPIEMAQEAYHGLAGEYVLLVEKETEADPSAILTQLLVSFGSSCGRGPFIEVGATRQCTNEFLLLVGATGDGKKGTSLSWVSHLFGEVDNEWMTNRCMHGISSGQGIIKRVRDAGENNDIGVSDKRLLILLQEGSRIFKSAKLETSITSEVLRQLWESGNVDDPTKNSPIRATNAHVSLIAHMTPREIESCIDAVSKENGLMNRFLFCACRRQRFLSSGGKIPHMNGTIDRMRDALAFAVSIGGQRFYRTSEAEEFWCEHGGMYESLETKRAGTVGSILSRASTHSLRLALIYALLDKSLVITLDHLQAAKAVVEYSERSARWVFGSSKDDEACDKLYRFIVSKREAGSNFGEFYKVFSNKKTSREVAKIVQALVQDGLVIPGKIARYGRQALPWIATVFRGHRRDPVFSEEDASHGSL